MFDANQTALTNDHQRVLKAFAECVKANPGKQVTLEGRADPRGNAEYNEGLANRRADSVKRGLAALGVPDDQVTMTVGEQLCSEATEECWQKNRSVAVIVQP